MRRSTFVWITMLALVVGLAAPVLAQQAPATSAPASTPAAKPEPAKPAKTKSATGTVKNASNEALVLESGKDKTKKEWTFTLDKDTKITRGKQTLEAKDIAANDTATVAYSEVEGKMVAKTVKLKAAKTAAKPKTQ
jgi:hypothetical protein